jgi:ATP-dependent RNA helicase DOB1
MLMFAVCGVQDMIKVSAELGDALLALQDAARHIAEVSLECKVETRLDVDEYVESFRPTLMDISYFWAKVRFPPL